MIHPKQDDKAEIHAPPMGWNSWDSYGGMLSEKTATSNLEALGKEYVSVGYDHFVIDIGWYKAGHPIEGQISAKNIPMVHMNDFGIVQPSSELFPNGFQPIIDRCHELGVKFGLHLMRGIPRQAVAQNLPVKDTTQSAQDIANKWSKCPWCNYNYGVNTDNPGAQEYYNSLIAELAGWGVDFIKYDNITPYPKEIKAVGQAIQNSGRQITLSLSPGNYTLKKNLPTYRRYSHMVRVTGDVWDNWQGIKKSFRAWKKWQEYEQPGFWIDLDMIPFGQLQMQKQLREGRPPKPLQARLLGRDYCRYSKLTQPEKRTFITMRALATSPLMIGGDLPSMDAFSKTLLTNQQMLRCSLERKVGRLITRSNGIQIWNAQPPEKLGENKGNTGGWIGIFNLRDKIKRAQFSLKELGVKRPIAHLVDIWNEKEINLQDRMKFTLPPHGCFFLHYTSYKI